MALFMNIEQEGRSVRPLTDGHRHALFRPGTLPVLFHMQGLRRLCLHALKEGDIGGQDAAPACQFHPDRRQISGILFILLRLNMVQRKLLSGGRPLLFIQNVFLGQFRHIMAVLGQPLHPVKEKHGSHAQTGITGGDLLHHRAAHRQLIGGAEEQVEGPVKRRASVLRLFVFQNPLAQQVIHLAQDLRRLRRAVHNIALLTGIVIDMREPPGKGPLLPLLAVEDQHDPQIVAA